MQTDKDIVGYHWDLTLHGEIKLNSTWHHYSQGTLNSRNIEVNRIMNMLGFRGAVEFGNFTLPDDLTELTKYSYNLNEDREPNDKWRWLDAKEIAALEHKIIAECNEILFPGTTKHFFFMGAIGSLFGCNWRDFIDYSEDLPQALQNIRVIYWFD